MLRLGALSPSAIRTLIGFLIVPALVGVIFVYQAGSKLALAADTTATASPASISAIPQVINEAQVPMAQQGVPGTAQLMPFLTGRSMAEWTSIKAAASGIEAIMVSPVGASPSGSIGLETPTASTKFLGMADSSSICPPSGCQPPDMAIAASKWWVLQGVNTAFAVYTTSGKLRAGWPKTAEAFFGVPAPSPSGCASLPFLSDPRAFYDSNTGRFWAAILEVEGAFGINPGCNFATKYWVAVSQTSNPNGAWFIYAFDMSGGTTNAADFTQIGFDAQASYFGGNMFNKSGTAYKYDEIFGVNKKAMDAGDAVTAYGFSHLSVGGLLVDTVQPVEVQDAPTGPRAGLFINSFDMNGDPSGNNCFSTACHGVEVWAIAKPGTSSSSLSGTFVNTGNYILPPLADQPGCTQCIDTNDTRIAATPVYHDGLISFALNTGASNGTQIVPTIFWGQVGAQLSDKGVATSSTFLLQSGYFGFSGDGAAYYGALMPDDEGNLFMVYEFSNSSTNPESAYVSRRVTFTPGAFHDSGKILFAGATSTLDSRWGDFEATSYDGRSPNHVWIAGEHVGSGGDWATGIGKLSYPLSQP
jgi:hypothetical protein